MDEDNLSESTEETEPSEEQTKGVSSDLIRGHINTIILRSLYDGDKYGYEIIAEIERKSHGQYSLKQPSLYSALKRLEKDGYITSYWGGSVGGGRRKYFSLTDAGKEIAEQNQSEWEYSRTIIDSLISDRDFDFSNPAPSAVNMRVLRSTTSRVPAGEEDGETLDFEPVFDDSAERERLQAEFDQKNSELEERRAQLDAESEALAERERALEEEQNRQNLELEEARSTILSLREQDETSRAEREEREAEYLRLQQQLQEESERSTAALEEEKKQHEQALEEEKKQHEQALEEEKKQHEEALEEEKKQHEQAVEAERTLREQMLAEERARHEQALSDNREHYERSIGEAEKARDAAIAEEQKKHEQAIAEEQKMYEQAFADEQKKHEQALADEQKKHEQALAEERKLYERSLDEAGKARTEALEEQRKQHLQALADQEARIRDEMEREFQIREREILRRNYINLVNTPPAPDPDAPYYVPEPQPAQPAPRPDPDSDYRAVLGRVYASAVPAAETQSELPDRAQSLNGIDFTDIETRAARDGLRVVTTGSRTVNRSVEENTVHKGKALFLSAVVVFFYCVVIGSIVLGVQSNFGISQLLPYFIWGSGVALLLVTGLAYANKFGERSLRRKSPAILNAIVIYALLVIVTLIVALALKIDFASPSALANFIVVPVVSLFGIVIFGIVYYLQVREYHKK